MTINWHEHLAAVLHTDREQQTLRPVRNLDRVLLKDLIGLDEPIDRLMTNTLELLADRPAENALLWGARGSGKSALIKAVFTALADQQPLRLIQLAREEMAALPELAEMASEQPYKFIVFCDDLVFGKDSGEYRALRVFLQGSVELPPQNMVVYATSNLRYILPQDMAENRKVTQREMEPQYSQQTEDQLALADRFGIWLSFHSPTMKDYIHKVKLQLGDSAEVIRQAEAFARQRAVHNYRTAEQFIRQYRRRLK